MHKSYDTSWLPNQFFILLYNFKLSSKRTDLVYLSTISKLSHPPSLIFSPDSQRVAYVAGPGNPKAALSAMRFVVVDGEEGKHYSVLEPHSLTFSPDSQGWLMRLEWVISGL